MSRHFFHAIYRLLVRGVYAAMLSSPRTLSSPPEEQRPIDVGLCMGYLPGRKRPAVWVEREGIIEPLAYFRSEDAYARFKALLGGKGLVQVP